MYTRAHNRTASATLTCTLCLCRRHNGNNNNNKNNDISYHICLRLSHPWMIRHVCMCLPWRSPFPPISSPLSLFLSLGKVSGTILLTCHFRSTDFEWKTRTSRNLHGPLADDRAKGMKGVRRDGGREGKCHNSTRMQSVKICKRRWMSIKLIKLATGIEFAWRQQAHVAYYS